MSITDLEPEGFSEQMVFYACISRKPRIYPQGMGDGRFAIWLELEGGGSIMIGYGAAPAAVTEAKAALIALAETVQPQLDELVAAMK